jgi:hypothetical protein
VLRAFLGLEQNSNMHVYAPLSGQDIEVAQRKRLGMVKSIEP